MLWLWPGNWILLMTRITNDDLYVLPSQFHFCGNGIEWLVKYLAQMQTMSNNILSSIKKFSKKWHKWSCKFTEQKYYLVSTNMINILYQVYHCIFIFIVGIIWSIIIATPYILCSSKYFRMFFWWWSQQISIDIILIY